MLRRDSSQRSFFDQTLYDRLIKPGNFLKRLDKVADDNPPGPDARRGARGRGRPFVGYKAHPALDSDSGLLTREDLTPGNVHEGRHLRGVLDPSARTDRANKAYDSNRNHHLLASRNLRSAIILSRPFSAASVFRRWAFLSIRIKGKAA